MACPFIGPFPSGRIWSTLRVPQTGQAVRRRVRGFAKGGIGVTGNGGVKGGGRTRINVLVVRNETPLFTAVLAQALDSEAALRLLSRPLSVDAALEFCSGHHPGVVLLEATR